ncbi:hypothetical protein ACPUD3_10165 [Leuconostoc mesenteroides subsp. dextranicum]|uniref:hypothetical protein n=1 Tax=Leuconostoc mesenteroides TaxID=1245 RepID=UPI003C90A712
MVKKIIYSVIMVGIISLFLVCNWQSSVTVNASVSTKKVISINDNLKYKLFESSQTNTTIEQINDHFLVQDTETQKQYILTKDKKIDIYGKKMMVYAVHNSKKTNLFLSENKKELVYKNNTFFLSNTGKKIFNVQTAIDKVKSMVKLTDATFSGSNIRLLNKNGRLYYRINVYQSQQLIRTYQVYSDNGKVNRIS